VLAGAAVTRSWAVLSLTGRAELPGAGLFPHETVAGERRMIGDCLLECELEPGVRRTLAGFENHAGVTRLDAGAEPLGAVVAGSATTAQSGFEGVRVGNAIGTYLHGPLLPRNAWLADWLLERASSIERASAELEPLPDDLESEAHAVAAARARSRGGRY
jgi:CobQ-like glutamine amidotransferase family enzyme